MLILNFSYNFYLDNLWIYIGYILGSTSGMWRLAILTRLGKFTRPARLNLEIPLILIVELFMRLSSDPKSLGRYGYLLVALITFLCYGFRVWSYFRDLWMKTINKAHLDCLFSYPFIGNWKMFDKNYRTETKTQAFTHSPLQNYNWNKKQVPCHPSDHVCFWLNVLPNLCAI